jgi:hypothetical protein
MVETTAERDDEDEPPARPEPAMPRTLPLPASERPLGTLSFHPNVLDSSSTTVSLRRRKMLMIVAGSAALSATALVLALVLRSPEPAAPLPEDDRPAHSVLPAAAPARPGEEPARRTEPVWPAAPPPAPTLAREPDPARLHAEAVGAASGATPRRLRRVKSPAPRSAAQLPRPAPTTERAAPAPTTERAARRPAPATAPTPPAAPGQPAHVGRMKKW